MLLYLPLFPPEKMFLQMTSSLISRSQELFGLFLTYRTNVNQICHLSEYSFIYLFNGILNNYVLATMIDAKKKRMSEKLILSKIQQRNRVCGHW